MLVTPGIELARHIATSAHRGQLDKIKVPYIEHPAMVARLVQLLPDFARLDTATREAAVCVAWLHDIIEDTTVTADALAAVGFAPAVVTAVVAMTRTVHVGPDDYYVTIRSDTVARVVKTADIASNLAPERVSRLDAATKNRLEKKYSAALDALGVDRAVVDDLHLAASRERERSDASAGPGLGPVIDMHTHSNRSDGTDSPRILVMKAHRAGITHLGLTDHDTTAGWDEAGEAADWVGLHLIRGIELSTRNEGRSQHLLAYEPDPTHPALAELLRRTLVARETRIPLMVERIAAKVPLLRLEDVQRIAGDGSPGRPHIADALVSCGAAKDRTEAFERYLAKGSDTYVARWSPAIEDALAAVVAAGGVPVIAHAWGRDGRFRPERFEQLRSCGLRGIEVNHVEHDDAARRELSAIARTLDLVITGSSDHHGVGKQHNDLASETTDLAEFERLQSFWSEVPVRRQGSRSTARDDR